MRQRLGTRAIRINSEKFCICHKGQTSNENVTPGKWEFILFFFFFLRILKRDLNLLTGLLQTKLGPEKELSITFWPQRNHRKSQPVSLECIWETIPGLLIWYLELPKNPPEISFYFQFNGITPQSYQNHKWIL